MADDECDLETLSALLDEDSDGDFVDDGKHLEIVSQTQSEKNITDTASRQTQDVVTEEDGQSEFDMETISAMLEEDLEPEGSHSGDKREDLNADDIAAFFNDASDSENDSEFQDNQAASTSQEGNANKATEDPVHVQKLQDELVMMQQRMLEIQKMLATQNQTPQHHAAGIPVSSEKPRGKPGTTKQQSCKGNKILEDAAENMFFDKPSTSSSLSSSQLERTNSKSKSSINKTSIVASTKKTSENREDNKTASSISKVSKHANKTSIRTSSLSGAEAGQGSCSSVRRDSSSSTVVKNIAFAKALKQDHAEKVPQVMHNPETDNPNALKRDLFGDDDSNSDWEDMDGEKPQLSSAGKEIQKLIKRGPRERQAHVPNVNLDNHGSSLRKERAALLTPRKQNPGGNGQPTKAFTGPTKTEAKDEKNFITEAKSNIRIINPVMSSSTLSSKMESRKLIQLSVLHRKVNTPDVQGDWVTMGVMVHKSEARKSSNGSTFCIWKLSDLQSMDETVSFFLFGETYKQLWKTEVGVVMGILNPDIMDPAERNPSEVSFTVKNPAQVMLLGQSKDLGWCIGKTKHGNKCSKFVNKKFGEYCEYHVKAAYKKTSAKRGELQGGCPGRKPKSFEKRLFGSKSNGFYHQGQYYTTGGQKSGAGRDHLTLASLQDKQQQTRGKVTTVSLHDMPTKARESIEKKLPQENETFMDLMMAPSVGSMNLVKHLIKADGQKTASKDSKGTVIYQSVQPSALLKEHKKSLQQKTQNQEQQKPCTPVLGKGFYPGQDIDLFSENLLPPAKSKLSKNEIAKLKAIQKVQAKGGIEKDNPNATRKRSPNAEKVKKRVLEQVENDAGKHSRTDVPSSGSSRVEDEEPARKRSRLLGNVDVNSAEIQQLLKAKSSHKGALAEAEAEKEEKYFDNLEKREMMEEKMKTITSLETTVFSCAQCQYTALSVGNLCKQEGHKVTKSKGRKRFFQCKKCKHHITTLHKFPADPCSKCGELSFEKASMHREKSGPKLESEILCIRGDEVKYLNSLQQKVYLNS